MEVDPGYSDSSVDASIGAMPNDEVPLRGRLANWKSIVLRGYTGDAGTAAVEYSTLATVAHVPSVTGPDRMYRAPRAPATGGSHHRGPFARTIPAPQEHETTSARHLRHHASNV